MYTLEKRECACWWKLFPIICSELPFPPSHCHMNYSNYGNEPLRNFEGLFDSGSMQHHGAREGADPETKAGWQRRIGWGQDHVYCALLHSPDFAEGPVPACAVSQSSAIKGPPYKTWKGDVRKRRGCRPWLTPAPCHSPQPTEGMPLRSTLRSSFISTSGPSMKASCLPVWGWCLLGLVTHSATTFCKSCGIWVHM